MDKVREYGRVAELLLGYVEGHTTDLAADVMSVPSAHYTDPVRWQQEIDVIFKRLPLLVALSVEVAQPGDYKAMDIIGLPVLVVRGSDGRIRAFLNVCAHRGAPVAEEGSGNRSRFTCRYHGWTYGTDGRLVGISDSLKFAAPGYCGRDLTPLPCDERAGLIFAVLTPGRPIDLPAFLGEMLAELEPLGLQHYHFCGRREILGGNWKAAFDGFLEGYHFSALHPHTIHQRVINNVMHFDPVGPHLRIAFAQRNIRALRDVPPDQWGTRENNGYDFVRALFPNVSIFLAPEIGQIAQVLPGPNPGQNRTILTFVSARPPQNPGDEARLAQMMTFLHGVMRDDDYAMTLQVQKGLESRAFTEVVFGRNERGNHWFHESVERCLTAST